MLDLELVLLGGPLKPRVWRRLRVSGGTPLPALADKVLLPAMVGGWRGGGMRWWEAWAWQGHGRGLAGLLEEARERPRGSRAEPLAPNPLRCAPPTARRAGPATTTPACGQITRTARCWGTRSEWDREAPVWVVVEGRAGAWRAQVQLAWPCGETTLVSLPPLGAPVSSCGSVDMMHTHRFHDFMDAAPWRLADLLQVGRRVGEWWAGTPRSRAWRFCPARRPSCAARILSAACNPPALPRASSRLRQEPGQELGLLYDLGDGWRHVITCVQVLPQADSTGAAALLDGAGACPPEDSSGLDGMGCHAYQARAGAGRGACGCVWYGCGQPRMRCTCEAQQGSLLSACTLSAHPFLPSAEAAGRAAAAGLPG